MGELHLKVLFSSTIFAVDAGIYLKKLRLSCILFSDITDTSFDG